MDPKMTIPEVNGFLQKVFPQIDDRFEVLELAPMKARVKMNVSEQDLRPGGTVSGPAMFALADVAYYIATLAMIGPEALTVTTSCAIDFMRKPAPSDMWAEARVLKLGKVLSVGDVTLYSQGMAEPVAHANMTYAIPPKRVG